MSLVAIEKKIKLKIRYFVYISTVSEASSVFIQSFGARLVVKNYRSNDLLTRKDQRKNATFTKYSKYLVYRNLVSAVNI